MKDGSGSAAIVVVGVIAAGAIGATGFGVGAAATRHPAAKSSASSTFEMYANVDAEADLGSNYDAVSARTVPGSSDYIVVFKKPIGHCAAVVQDGKAGGPDDVSLASSDVVPHGKKGFDISFGIPDGNGGSSLKHEPFMLTVTCTS